MSGEKAYALESRVEGVCRPQDTRMERIKKINDELLEPPRLNTFFLGHPQCTEEVWNVLASFGIGIENLSKHDIDLVLDSFEKACKHVPDSSILKHKESIDVIASIRESYEQKLIEYEEAEREAYKQLDLNGESFENITVNRLIRKLYAGNGNWGDIDENVAIHSFNNEWQRLYQVIRNEDPLATRGWGFEILDKVQGIIERRCTDEVDEDGDVYDKEGVFSDLDEYFEIQNLDPRFITTTIDLLFHAQELEKETSDAFVGPEFEIDQRIHEHRDVAFRDILSDYIDERLRSRLSTVFQSLKYKAIMHAWEESDSDYSNYSELTISKEQLNELAKKTNTNHSLKTFYVHERPSLAIPIAKDVFAEYVSNDGFYIIEEKAEGQYNPVAIKDYLEHRVTAGAPASNDMIGEYRALMDLRVRASLKELFGFELLDLSPREQYYFLSFLKRVTPPLVEDVQHFTALHSIEGMRTFLALERGDVTLAEDIVAFGKHQDIAPTVFRYYGALLDSAERAEELVREVSGCDGEACNELAEQVRENILNRAQIDLERAVRAKTDAEKAGLAERLQTYVAHAKEYVALLQEVGGRVESKSAGELSASEREQMKILQRGNYNKLYKGPEFDEFKVAVFGSLNARLDQPGEHSDTVFNILKDREKVVCYDRFDTLRLSDGREVTYFGSFNADPAYGGVGGVMLEETVSKHLEDGRPMVAHCDPTQDISKKYIEDGFVATSLVDFHGHDDFEIWRIQYIDVHFPSKQMTVAELLDLKDAGDSVIVREQRSPEQYDELQDGKVLTRYFKHDGVSYVVFETLPEPLREMFRLEP